MRGFGRLFIATAGLVLAVGCAGKVNYDVLAGIKKVGLLTVTVDKVGDKASDDAVMQQVADFAASEYLRVLGNAQQWELVPPEQYMSDPDFQNLAKPTEPGPIRAELERMAAAGELTPADAAGVARYMKAKLTGDDEALKELSAESVDSNARMLQSILDQHNKKYIAATGYPLVPYSALKPEGGGTKITIKAGDAANQKDPKEAVRDMLFAAIGKVAEKHGLDAMAVVYCHTKIQATVGVGVIVGDRGNDSIKMDPTLFLIAKDGQKAIDMGYPVIDALTTSNMAVPVYTIAYSEKGSRTHPSNKKKFDYVIDLKDPEGKVLVEYKDLVTEAADEFWEELAAEMTKK